MKRISMILSATVLVGAALITTPAKAATFTYPGAAPCNTTLQACIDGVASGSVIELATNMIAVGASIDIEDKSLTIRPASGFQPVLEAPAMTGYSLNMYAGPGSPATTMRLIGLRVRQMQVKIQSQDDNGSHHEFLLKDSDVRHSIDSNNSPGIAVDQRSPSRVRVLNNYVKTTGQPIQVWNNSDLGATHTVVEGNRVEPFDTDNAYVGIETRADGDSLQTIDVFNNVVSDSAGCNCGIASGISTYVSPGGNGRFNIVGNTLHSIDLNYSPIFIYGQAGSTHVARIFNNSVSNSDGAAIGVVNAGDLKVQNDYNNLFNSGPPNLDGFQLGRHTTHMNPRYRDAANRNLRLTSNSPLVDRGVVCQPGGLGRTDAAGRFRLAKGSVDIGAYERDAGPVPAGRNLFGTGGANTLAGGGGVDILCGFKGRDVLRGRGGRDWAYGGADNDRVVGGGGADKLFANGGRVDRLFGGSKPDLLVTKDGSGGDLADGDAGNDRCRTDAGDTRRSC